MIQNYSYSCFSDGAPLPPDHTKKANASIVKRADCEVVIADLTLLGAALAVSSQFVRVSRLFAKPTGSKLGFIEKSSTRPAHRDNFFFYFQQRQRSSICMSKFIATFLLVDI